MYMHIYIYIYIYIDVYIFMRMKHTDQKVRLNLAYTSYAPLKYNIISEE